MAAPEPIPRALGVVETLLDDYRRANGHLVTPIRLLGKNGLIHVVRQQYDIDIDVESVPWKPSAINACVFRFGDPDKVQRAEIYLPASLEVGWARMALATELAHLILDDSDSFSGNPVATASALIDSPIFSRSGNGAPEYVFHLAAMEMLLPWRRRALLPVYRWGLFGANRKRVEHFGVPESIIHLRTRRFMKKLLKNAHADLSLA